MVNFIKDFINNKKIDKVETTNKIPNISKTKVNPSIEIVNLKSKDEINVDIYKEIEIPENINHYITYNNTDYSKYYNEHKWEKGSNQDILANKWALDNKKSDRGIATIDDRYLVAVTDKFGNVNDNIDVILDDGTKIKCKIADIKNQEETDCTEYGHIVLSPKGNEVIDVIEWEIVVPKDQMKIDDWKGKRVSKILKIKE